MNSDLIAWSKGQAEIEFLIKQGEHIIPIEVKSSKRSLRSKSLDSFVDRYKPIVAYKISGQNFRKNKKKKISTLPIYLCRKLVE